MIKKLFDLSKIIIFFVGWAAVSSLLIIPDGDPAVWRFFAELVPLAVIIAFSAFFIALEKGDVRIPIKDNLGKGLITGVAVGILWIGLSSAVLFGTGLIEVSSFNEISQMWLWILAVFLNVIMQELLVRGYIYQLLKTRYGLTLAVIVTTLLFTLMHGGAFEAGIIPVINVATMCLFTTALYESEKTLIAPIMAHAVWNIVGAIVLGGVSLADDYPSLMEVTTSGGDILSGGAYKIEASVVVTVVNICLMLYFYRKAKKSVF